VEITAADYQFKDDFIAKLCKS